MVHSNTEAHRIQGDLRLFRGTSTLEPPDAPLPSALGPVLGPWRRRCAIPRSFSPEHDTQRHRFSFHMDLGRPSMRRDTGAEGEACRPKPRAGGSPGPVGRVVRVHRVEGEALGQVEGAGGCGMRQ